VSKYNINECFGIRAHLTAPVNQPVAGFAGMALSNMHTMLESRDGIDFKTYKVDVDDTQIDIHIISPVDIENSAEENKRPCIMDIHGGGFVFDAAPHMYELAARYAIETCSVVVLPRYRLTPRNKYPANIHDCTASYEWIKSNADMLNIDTGKIGIMGDSAGGYLAITITNYAIERGDSIAFQLLIYPVTDTRMGTESMALYEDTPVWNTKNSRSMWKMYFGKMEIDKEALSWLVRELPDGIPATYVETAEFDCLHDEGLQYADRLKDMGVSVEINETKETMHGFDEVKCPITEAAVCKRIEFMKSHLY